MENLTGMSLAALYYQSLPWVTPGETGQSASEVGKYWGEWVNLGNTG